MNDGAILGINLRRQVHLTLDTSSESATIKIATAQISRDSVLTPGYAHLQDHSIWDTDKDNCGLLTSVKPVKLTGSPLLGTKQYPLSKEAVQRVRPIIEKLSAQGVIVKN